VIDATASNRAVLIAPPLCAVAARPPSSVPVMVMTMLDPVSGLQLAPLPDV